MLDHRCLGLSRQRRPSRTAASSPPGWHSWRALGRWSRLVSEPQTKLACISAPAKHLPAPNWDTYTGRCLQPGTWRGLRAPVPGRIPSSCGKGSLRTTNGTPGCGPHGFSFRLSPHRAKRAERRSQSPLQWPRPTPAFVLPGKRAASLPQASVSHSCHETVSALGLGRDATEFVTSTALSTTR